MKRLAILIHGFNVRDGGRDTVGMLQPFFLARGYDVMVVRYGLFGLYRVYRKNDKVAKRVAKISQSAKAAGYTVVAVGHSNGCDILNRAVNTFQAHLDHLTFINPALGKTRAPCAPCDVWYNAGDKPVRWARLLPKHPWGEMGATGYVGTDLDIENHDAGRDYPVVVSGHSDIFTPEKLAYFGAYIVDAATNRL